MIGLEPCGAQHGPVVGALKLLAEARFAPERYLQMAAGSSNPGILELLIEQKLVDRCNEQYPDMHPLYALTKKGAAVAGAKYIKVLKADRGYLTHLLMAQYETLVTREELRIVDYRFNHKRAAGATGPAAQWICSDGRKLDVRIESTRLSNMNGELDRAVAVSIGRPTVFIFGTAALRRQFFWQASRYAVRGIPAWKSVGKERVMRDRHIPVPGGAWEHIYVKVFRDECLRSLSQWGVGGWGGRLCSAWGL